MNIIAISPPNITSFSPFVDASWLESQSDLDVEKINTKFSTLLNNEVFICNEVTGVRFSLFDLANSLTSKIPDIQYGNGIYCEELHNSYLESAHGDLRVKLRGYKLSYEYHEPAKVTSIIDYSKELLGIVQNYSSGDKQMVFRDGSVK